MSVQDRMHRARVTENQEAASLSSGPAGSLQGAVDFATPSNLVALGSGRGAAGRGKGGRGGHSTAGRSTPWGLGPAPAKSAWASSAAPAKSAWALGPLPGETTGGNREASGNDQQPEILLPKMKAIPSSPSPQSAWSKPPPGASSQSATASKGSAPWKKRTAEPVAAGCGSPSAHGSPTASLEEAFEALSVGSRETAGKSQPDSGTSFPSTAATGSHQLISGCEFSNEPQTLQQLHNQKHVQELGLLREYDPEERDPSHTQLRIAMKQVWCEEKLEKGCEMLNRGIGQKTAAREAGVLLADLKKYWEENYAHSESDGSDSDY